MSSERISGDSEEEELVLWDEEDDDGDDHPYRGEMLGGAVADVCAGFDPSPLRFIFYQPDLRRRAAFLAAVTVVAAGLFGAGYALRVPGGILPGDLTLGLYLLGAVLVFVGLYAVLALDVDYRVAAKYYKNALLTPGVVVEEAPLVVVVLAPLGNGSGPGYSGLQRVDFNGTGLPLHSHRRGERVPCVSSFQRGDGLDRWVRFFPQPIAWGTGNRHLIDRCLKRLDAEEFNRLKAFVASGHVPNDDELILLDARGRFLSFSIRAETEKYRRRGGRRS